jgi:hypothetical protein
MHLYIYKDTNTHSDSYWLMCLYIRQLYRVINYLSLHTYVKSLRLHSITPWITLLLLWILHVIYPLHGGLPPTGWYMHSNPKISTKITTSHSYARLQRDKSLCSLCYSPQLALVYQFKAENNYAIKDIKHDTSEKALIYYYYSREISLTNALYV